MVFVLGETSTYLTTQWDTFISNFGLFTTLVTGLGILLYFLLQKSIEHRFQSKLESLKVDQQMIMLKFESFKNNQNERYPQLYFLTEQALGYITYLKSLQKFPSFDYASEEDVQAYCDAIEMNFGDKKRVLSLWDKDKGNAVSEIRRIKRHIDYNIAEVKYCDANDYLIYNELYFSDAVIDETRKLLDLMHAYWLNLDPTYTNPIFQVDLIELRKSNSEIRTKIDEQRKIWKAVMKKEVSS